jgi:amidase
MLPDLTVAAERRAAAERLAWSVVAAAFEVDDEDALTSYTRWFRAQGRAVSGVRLHECLTMFRGVARMLEEFVFSGVDLLATPTLAQPPQPLGSCRVGCEEEESFAAMTRLMPFSDVQHAGMFAVSVPMAVADGLPIGAMLGGPHGSEWRILDEVGAALSRTPRSSGVASGWD